jgi:DNA-binding winged helix-turn-helix (wHTH) protein
MSGRIVLKSRIIARSRGRPSGRVKIVEFDPDRRLLAKNGHELRRLTPQEALLLHLLVQRAPCVVRNLELQQALWPTTEFISSPQQRIREIVGGLRALLGDSADTPCFIENIPGVGYSFVGNVESQTTNSLPAEPIRQTGDIVDQITVAPDEIAAVNEALWWRSGILVASGIAILALLVIALVYGRSHGFEPRPPAQLGRLLARSTSEGRTAARIHLTHRPSLLALSADGEKLYAMEADGRTLSIVNIASGAVRTLVLPREARSMATSLKGMLYIGASSDGVMVVDAAEHIQPGIIPTGGPVRGIVVTPDGEKLFLALEYAGLKRLLWRTGKLDLVSDRICPEYLATDRQVTRLYVAYQCSGPGGRPGHDSVEIFDVEKEVSLGIVSGPPMVGGPLSVSPDGKLALLDGFDVCANPDYDHAGCPSIPSHVIHLLRPVDRRILRTFDLPKDSGLAGFLDNFRFLVDGTSLTVIDTIRYSVLEAWNAGEEVRLAAADVRRRRVYVGSRESDVLVLEPERVDCAQSPAGLAILYTGDGTLDDAIGITTLTSHGTFRFVPGRVGQAFFLDGNGYLSESWPGGYAFLRQDSTLALYVKFAAVESEMTLVEADNSQAGIHLFKSADGHFVFRSHPGGSILKSKTAVKPNVWYHLSVTKTDDKVVLYVDGEPEDSGAAPSRFADSVSPQFFGARSPGGPSFHGWLDEIAFYRRALTADEVKGIYKLREFGPCKL